ncbi:hypothetical protein GS545_13145 [Rhodococcus hoagii]|nr:hypothetical protein [Prescottella equi]
MTTIDTPDRVPAAHEPEQWGREFDINLPKYKSLADELIFAIETILAESNIEIHSVTSRPKERASFLEKIKRKEYSQPFSQMPDIVGARIVCLFVNDLPKIDRIIRENFDVQLHEDKIADSPNDTFGYMSIHYVCRLGSKYSGPRYKNIANITFEVQCRTILMDAWANVSHHLAYKGQASIPEEMIRDFHALSGLFHIADQQFQQINTKSLESEAKAAKVLRQVAEVRIDINRATLKALLREIYADREEGGNSNYSELVEELVMCGYTEINDLRKVLLQGESAALESERERPPADSDRFTDVGIAREALKLSDSKFAEVWDSVWRRKLKVSWDRRKCPPQTNWQAGGISMWTRAKRERGKSSAHAKLTTRRSQPSRSTAGDGSTR